MGWFAGDQLRYPLGGVGDGLRGVGCRVPEDVNGGKQKIERGEAGPHEDHLTP